MKRRKFLERLGLLLGVAVSAPLLAKSLETESESDLELVDGPRYWKIHNGNIKWEDTGTKGLVD